ncbi:MAG: UbiD family decarboxylase [Candidatus Adiutrix sp.]|jgi:UbiD family decarboxylase|nr:UbiD family decarboxylase [Candidatus Adiutrix sp.]
MRNYMNKLKARGELLEVHRPVDPRHELAAVTDAAHKHWGRPILFHNVVGTKIPVLTNLYGSRRRLAEIIGIEADSFCRQWCKLAAVADEKEMVSAVPVLNNIEYFECKLSDLPLITYSERDGAPYFTSAMFLAKEPDTGVNNLSFHRSMFVSDQELRCRLAPRHHLTMYHEKAESRGQYLEAAMLIGPPPAMFLTAAAPLAYEADEVDLAAKLQGEPIPMRGCRHIDLMVPETTEIVIEGRFIPNERRDEGPFGEFMGYYTPVEKNAVFEVLGITCRQDAVFHSVLCGSSEEVLTLELSVAANIYQRISAVLPGIIDVTCLPFVTNVVVKIKQHYEGHGRQVLLAVFGAEPTWARNCTVVDEDVDINKLDDVTWAVLTRSRPDRDIIIIPETPSFYRDPHKEHWGRVGIDATVPFARRREYERKRIPGADTVELANYFGQ